MAPSGTAQLVIAGIAPAGEIWQVGLWWKSSGAGLWPSSNGTADTVLTAMTTGQATWAALVAEVKLGFNAATNISRVKLYSFPTGGTHATAVAIHDLTPVVGTGGGSLPNPTSRVVTLQTGLAGRSFRGRIYLPATGEAMSGNTGKFSRTTTTLLSTLKAWINGNQASTYLSDGISGGLLSVASAKLNTATSVTSLRTDNLPDTQRRRANRETGVTFDTLAL